MPDARSSSVDPLRLRLRAGLACVLGALAGACGGGGGGGQGGGPLPSSDVTISGQVSFDRVPLAAGLGAGLDFGTVSRAPARAVVVEVLRADRSVVATTLSDADGRYSVTAPANAEVSLRVRAQTRSQGTAAQPATWNLSVRDNTDGNAVYAIEGRLAATGTADQVRDLHAASGWTGNGYGSPRAAAPFAVLDTLYAALQLAIAADPGVRLPELAAYWSPRNRASPQFRPTLGEIVTTSYRSVVDDPLQGGIYVQGLEDVDTDEYDAHVIAHEFFHFLEDFVTRSDTTGGQHSLFERLDARLAFSEGFGNAWAAMVVGNSLYRDSYGTRQGQSFHFDVEDNEWASFGRQDGWYSEVSVQAVLYDLFDTGVDGADSVALGIAPLYAVLRDDLRRGAALTTLFAFTAGLERQPAVPVPTLRALLAEQDVGREVALPDAFGSGERNSGGNPDALPVYLALEVNGAPVQACTSVRDGVDNKLGNRRLLRFDLAQDRRVEIVARSSDGDSPAPDPDFVIFRGGRLASSETVAPFVERYTGELAAGSYVLEVYEWTHADPGATLRRSRTCMNVSITG
jgi:hypothetical protein